MARIPEAEIERLKNEVEVVRLVQASGIELKRGRQGHAGPLPVPRGRHRQPGGVRLGKGAKDRVVPIGERACTGRTSATSRRCCAMPI